MFGLAFLVYFFKIANVLNLLGKSQDILVVIIIIVK